MAVLCILGLGARLGAFLFAIIYRLRLSLLAATLLIG